MTAHNRASKAEIAKIVLAPGDPLRAKLVAEQFLDDAVLITDVRNMLGYTGLYKGFPITVMATGMGGPSIGIYSYELFTDYEVDTIIRIGTCGGLKPHIAVGDLIVALTASTDSSWAHQYDLKGTLSPCCDPDAMLLCLSCAEKASVKTHPGMVFSSDLFSSYNALGQDSWKKWAAMGALAQDMETYALYATAAFCRKRALSVLTMTDSCVTNQGFGEEMRTIGLYPMIKVALETARQVL
ncbi:MAG: DeoD-type purine-nucleoside phosphorylase [Spirochaetia bacterium]|nr:DeoD-type purine-nucleoside phosphorylase [Spirochaetia bacterium]